MPRVISTPPCCGNLISRPRITAGCSWVNPASVTESPAALVFLAFARLGCLITPFHRNPSTFRIYYSRGTKPVRPRARLVSPALVPLLPLLLEPCTILHWPALHI
ncbi:hypothetical protein EsH8_IV_000124 [Colletotrichum jinshuiense]